MAQLIHAGKVLKEDGVVVSSLLQYQGPLVLHVVIRAPSPAPSPPPPSSSQTLENAASANGTASQSQQTERAGPSQEASTSQPSAANASFDAGPNVNGRWATNGSPALQQAVYQAAYEAALQVIRQSASTQTGWMPSAIPIPQPVLPAGVFHMHPPVGTTTGTIDGHGHGHGHGNGNNPGQGVPPPLLMPVLPLPVPAGQPVQIGYGFGYGAQDANLMRHRRPPPPGVHPQGVDGRDNAAWNEGAFGAGARGQGRHVVNQPRNRPRQFQLRFQINIRALLQFLVFAIIVYQHCPPRRFAVLVVLGAALWLSTMAPVRAFLRQLAGFRPPAPHPIPPVAAEREGLQQGLAFEDQRPIQDQGGLNPPPQVGVQNGAPHNRVLGVLRGIQTFVAGFITSLLPAVEPNAGGEGDGRQMGGAVAQDVFGGQ
jgi:hypothetical protein